MKRRIFSVFLLLVAGSIFAADKHDDKEALRVLGYDPCISLIKETDASVVKSKRKTVYFHGFGGNKDVAASIKRYYGASRLAGDVITFDFADAHDGISMDKTKSSLGQWNDIKTALYVLKKLHDAGETEVGITAHSRGGATAVNMVAALVDETGAYDERLTELGIDGTVRKALVSMLQKGHIVLECPLIDVHSVIQHKIEETTCRFSSNSWFASLRSPESSTKPVSYSTAVLANYIAPLVLKEYRPWAEQAIESALVWNKAQIPTIIHFQEYDEVIGSIKNIEFIHYLLESNGSECTDVHSGNDGGHNSSFKSFAAARNKFLKKYGASYKPL